MGQDKFEHMERSIREYFSCWIENTPATLEKIFSDDTVYSECYGPEYRGVGQIGDGSTACPLWNLPKTAGYVHSRNFSQKRNMSFHMGRII